jgi:hypothetical protein
MLSTVDQIDDSILEFLSKLRILGSVKTLHQPKSYQQKLPVFLTPEESLSISAGYQLLAA